MNVIAVDLERTGEIIKNLPEAAMSVLELRRHLLLWESGDLCICYAPFGHINPTARVAIVGITPGLTRSNQQKVGV